MCTHCYTHVWSARAVHMRAERHYLSTLHTIRARAHGFCPDRMHIISCTLSTERVRAGKRYMFCMSKHAVCFLVRGSRATAWCLGAEGVATNKHAYTLWRGTKRRRCVATTTATTTTTTTTTTTRSAAALWIFAYYSNEVYGFHARHVRHGTTHTEHTHSNSHNYFACGATPSRVVGKCLLLNAMMVYVCAVE